MENVRIKIAGLWTSMLFVFAYVDLFSLYRPDFRADLQAGEVGGFTVNQGFLAGTTVYIVVASLMVCGSLMLPPRITRVANIGLGFVYAVTILAGAIGEWTYYVLGSAVEIALLAGVIYLAWTWPSVNRRLTTVERRPAESVARTSTM
jgi:hypothetical protein